MRHAGRQVEPVDKDFVLVEVAVAIDVLMDRDPVLAAEWGVLPHAEAEGAPDRRRRATPCRD